MRNVDLFGWLPYPFLAYYDNYGFIDFIQSDYWQHVFVGGVEQKFPMLNVKAFIACGHNISHKEDSVAPYIICPAHKPEW